MSEGSKGRDSGRTRTWRQELIQSPQTDVAYWLAPHGLPSRHSYRTQGHQPKNVLIEVGLRHLQASDTWAIRSWNRLRHFSPGDVEGAWICQAWFWTSSLRCMREMLCDFKATCWVYCVTVALGGTASSKKKRITYWSRHQRAHQGARKRAAAYKQDIGRGCHSNREEAVLKFCSSIFFIIWSRKKYCVSLVRGPSCVPG